jgi:hypothetical protein
MTAMAKDLARGIDVRLKTSVTHASPVAEGWILTDESGHKVHVDALVLTAPLPQSVAIIRDVSELPVGDLERRAKAARYRPAFALMACLDGPAALPRCGAIRDLPDPLSWMADNQVKGLSLKHFGVTIHASHEYTAAHFNACEAEVAEVLIDAARPWLGHASVTHWQLHRWRYAVPENATPPPLVFTAPAPLVFAGDAFGGSKVEGAALSGLQAADRIKDLLPLRVHS